MNRTLWKFGLLALAAAAPAFAGTLTFTNRGDWTAVVTGLSNFDSGPQDPGGYQNFNTSAGLALTDLQIVGHNVTTGTLYDLTRVNADGSQPWYAWGTGAILRTGDKTASNTVYAKITFTNPVSAFGFNFGAGGSGGAPGSVTIAPTGLSSVTLNSLQQPAWGFWGVASDTQTFSSVNVYINDTNRYLVLDDIAYGSYSAPAPPPPPEPVIPPSEVAEPGTMLLLTMGGGLIFAGRRKRARR